MALNHFLIYFHRLVMYSSFPDTFRDGVLDVELVPLKVKRAVGGTRDKKLVLVVEFLLSSREVKRNSTNVFPSADLKMSMQNPWFLSM